MRTVKLVALYCLLACLLATVVLAQADSNVVVVPGSTDAHAAFILGMAGLSAFFAKTVGTWLVAIWNKAGGWLDKVSNGQKRVFAILFISILGLGANWVAAQLTHTTNWIVAAGLSLIGGVLSTVTAGVTIDSTKEKMLGSARRTPSGVV